VSTNLTEQISRRFPDSRRDFRKNPHVCTASACCANAMYRIY